MAVDHETFGQLLKKWRTRNDVSQDELAVQLGVNKESIQLWENGKREPANLRLVERAIRDVERDITYQRLNGSANPRKLVY